MRRVLFLLIFGLAGAGILIWLGVWQMQRLAWKEGVLLEIETRIAAAPGQVPVSPDPEVDRYQPVQAEGVIEPQELHVLVSRKRVGAGYRIIAPLTLADGRVVMLDRGFVPTEAKAETRAVGPISVTGNLHWPIETDVFTPEPDIAGNIWFARDVPAMADQLGTTPVLVVAKSKSDPNVTPLPVDTAGIPNDHLEYAITWFSLALIWVSMTVWFLWRTRADAESKSA